MDTIRNGNVCEEELKRIDVTRKDIRNIENSYHLNSVQRHKDDATSVECWVQEMSDKEEQNPVILYKPQGCSQSDKCDNLGDDDFLLCLQTPFQGSMMKKFGHNRIICIDSTHGTNIYHFLLVTILIVDEYGEGFPVGWCISNREDQFVLENFFRAIKEKIGCIVPSFFMSDDAEHFHNAWRSVFGNVDNKILCTWHVDRAWREKLSLIKNKETQLAVYHNLRVLMDEPDKAKFETLLTRTLQQLQVSDATQEFARYFTSTYVGRKQQWASCYRQNSIVNTNMHIEAFHCTLKYVYLGGKVNKLLDKCLHALLKISRDKSYERLIKITKGKKSRKFVDTQQRHIASEKMDTRSVTHVEDRLWNVLSESDSKKQYKVTMENTHCPDKCILRCDICNICVHSYACTCPDYVALGNICKHIHLTVRFMGVSPCKKVDSTSNDLIEVQKAIKSATAENRGLDQLGLKNKAITNTQIIASLIEKCSDKDILQTINSQLSSIIGLIKCHNAQKVPRLSLPSTSAHEPANKKITPQRLFSTRKRKRIPKVRLAKPTLNEKQGIENKLQKSINMYTTMETAQGTCIVNIVHGQTDTVCIFIGIMVLMCSESRAYGIINNNKRKLTQTEVQRKSSSIPDRIIDYDITKVKDYMEDDAWQQLGITRVHKKEHV